MPIEKGFQADFAFEAGAPASSTSAAPRLTEWAPERWPPATDWRPVLAQFLASPAARQLDTFLKARLAAGAVIYPPQPLRALALTPLAQVKVVILGQDPYHGAGQAEGLAFSVAPGVKLPPSLRNIFKEIARDRGSGNAAPAGDGSLVRWAQQGVLLLNACLTVEENRPSSHAQRGWEALSDAIVRAVALTNQPVVFMLWGAHAQAKQGLIASCAAAAPAPVRHMLLRASHPSPLAARRGPQPFLGCGHFGQANVFLKQQGRAPIDW